MIRHIICHGVIIGIVSSVLIFLILLPGWNRNTLLMYSCIAGAPLVCMYMMKDIFVLSLIFPDIDYKYKRKVWIVFASMFIFTFGVYSSWLILSIEWYYYGLDLMFYGAVIVVLYVIIQIFKRGTGYDKITRLYSIPVATSVFYHAVYAFVVIPIFMGAAHDYILKFLTLSIFHPIATEMKMWVFRHYSDLYDKPYNLPSRSIFPMEYALNSTFAYVLMTQIQPIWLNIICSTMLTISTASSRVLRARLDHADHEGRNNFQLIQDIASIIASPVFVLYASPELWSIRIVNTVQVMSVLTCYQLILLTVITYIENRIKETIVYRIDSVDDVPISRTELILCCYTHIISTMYLIFNFRIWPMLVICMSYGERCK